MNNRQLNKKLRSLRGLRPAVEPDALWATEARATLLEKIKPVAAERVLPIVMPRSFGRRLMFAMRPVMAAFMVIGFGAVGWAASFPTALGSKPGDVLYSLKTASEKAQLTFTADSSARTYLQLEFVGRRANEMAALAESGASDREENIVVAMDSLENEIKNVRRELETARSVAVAKAVDRKVAEIHAVVGKTRHLLSQSSQTKMDAMQALADDLSLKAVSVLVADAKSDEEKTDAASRVKERIDVAEKSIAAASTQASEEAKAAIAAAKAALENDDLAEAMVKVQESSDLVAGEEPVADENANVNTNENANVNANTGTIKAIEQ
jgi:hypothetical protein